MQRSAVPTVKPDWKEFEIDPEPIEDGMQQEEDITTLAYILREHFKGQTDVFVSAGGFLFFDPTNKNRLVTPDCYIALGVDPEFIKTMPNYLIWEAGKPPDFVVEVASPSTAANDLGSKRTLYASLGITEYWRFDPTGGDIYGQPLTGEGLVDGTYQPFPRHSDEDGSLWAHSQVLNLDFYWPPEERFRIKDSATGEWLNTLGQEKEARRLAEAARQTAEAEVERLRARLEQLKGYT